MESWEAFQIELAELDKKAAPVPSHEADEIEQEWVSFQEACDLRSVGVQVHERLRSERDSEPDGIAKSADRKKAAARTYLQRRMASGESAAAVIASVSEKSASTAALLREVAHEN